MADNALIETTVGCSSCGQITAYAANKNVAWGIFTGMSEQDKKTHLSGVCPTCRNEKHIIRERGGGYICGFIG